MPGWLCRGGMVAGYARYSRAESSAVQRSPGDRPSTSDAQSRPVHRRVRPHRAAPCAAAQRCSTLGASSSPGYHLRTAPESERTMRRCSSVGNSWRRGPAGYIPSKSGTTYGCTLPSLMPSPTYPDSRTNNEESVSTCATASRSLLPSWGPFWQPICHRRECSESPSKPAV